MTLVKSSGGERLSMAIANQKIEDDDADEGRRRRVVIAMMATVLMVLFMMGVSTPPTKPIHPWWKGVGRAHPRIHRVILWFLKLTFRLVW